MKLTIIAGDWPDNQQGRPSGYMTKVAKSAGFDIINGGTYFDLPAEHAGRRNVLWAPNIPNHLPKLVNEVQPLVITKNNLDDKYSLAELENRLKASSAELLIEFTGNRRNILAYVITKAGFLRGTFHSPEDLGRFLRKYFASLHSPLDRFKMPSDEGKFGCVRKHDIHTGIDLYCAEGAPVKAMEDGQVIRVGPFTGPKVDMPWWNSTEYIAILGEHGVIVYGEVEPAFGIRAGSIVSGNTTIGYATTVLRKDKGKPMCMLHLERYKHYGFTEPLRAWEHDTPKPPILLDPTILLRL